MNGVQQTMSFRTRYEENYFLSELCRACVSEKIFFTKPATCRRFLLTPPHSPFEMTVRFILFTASVFLASHP